jgi:site-specific DNA recombinase
MLAGLLRCGKCGAKYTLESSGKLGPDGEAKYRYYNCRRSLREGKEQCVGRAYPQDVIEKAVLEHLAQRIFTDETCKEILRHVVEEAGIVRKRVHVERRDLEVQLADTKRRLSKWYEAFERGDVAEEDGTKRLRELQAEEKRLVETLAKVVPIKQVPPDLYKDETIWKFQASLRQLFASGDEGLAKHYMRFLVDRIEVNGTRVEIKAKPTAAVALMAKAAGGSTGVLTATDAVLTHGDGWLRLLDSNQRPGG